MKDIFKSLNLLFKDDNIINYLIEKLQHNEPVDKKYKDFTVENNDLIYKPLNLAVVKNSDKQAVLTKIFNNNENLIVGRGVLTIYKSICTQFLNITRNDVAEYVKQLPYHLLLTDKNYVTAKPIIEHAPNLRYQVDLIDMSSFESHNKHYNYILNCVDVYSRYCWLRLLKKKEAGQVKNY
jgi:hypothetical protein